MVLKNLPLNFVGRIQAIYIASLYSGYVPACWRRSTGFFIPKPGGADYSKSKAFHPITLTSFLFKTMERAVLRHLETAHNVHNRLNVNQHAFRKGSSCDSALSDMVDGIESSILRNQYALGIFLDIKGAFDNLNVDSSIQGMEWYQSVQTEIKGITAIRTLTQGTPQGGGILSPLVWNLAFNELLDDFTSGPAQFKGFADDTVILLQGPDIHALIEQGQEAVNRALFWNCKWSWIWGCKNWGGHLHS